MKKLSLTLAGMALAAGFAAATPAAAHWDGRRDGGWHGYRHHRHHQHHHWSHRPHYYGHGYRTPPRVVYVPRSYYGYGYGNW